MVGTKWLRRETEPHSYSTLSGKSSGQRSHDSILIWTRKNGVFSVYGTFKYLGQKYAIWDTPSLSSPPLLFKAPVSHYIITRWPSPIVCVPPFSLQRSVWVFVFFLQIVHRVKSTRIWVQLPDHVTYHGALSPPPPGCILEAPSVKQTLWFSC